MYTCPVCSGIGKRRPRNLIERVANRAKIVCSTCNAEWYWRRVLFQDHVQCPGCGTGRLTKRKKYDRIDNKSHSLVRRFLGLFGAPIYHCTFCRLQFRDYHRWQPAKEVKSRASAGS